MEKFLELKLPSINNRLKKRMRWKKLNPDYSFELI